MKLNTAFTDDYIMQVSKQIFAPVTVGESVFCRWFPGHGMTVRMMQIFSDESFLKIGFGEKYGKTILVRIDASDFAIDPLHLFFMYVKKKLADELSKFKITSNVKEANFARRTPPTVFIIQEIGNMCIKAVDKGFDVVFIIEVGNFKSKLERELFSAWARIVERHLDKIHTHINGENRKLLDRGALPAVLIQSMITVALPDKKECDHYVNYYEKLWAMKLSTRQINKIFEVCGHDSWLIKEALRGIKDAKSVNDLVVDPNLLLKAKIQYELYGDGEKEVMETMFIKGKIPKSMEKIALELENVNFWGKDRKIMRIIEQVIVQRGAAGELNINPKDEKLYLGSIDISQKLSPIENKILAHLFEGEGKIVGRDAVAKLIWESRMEDKYSDWAIDKTISRLRKKLSLYTNLYTITTKKKKGFVLEG
ncbi:hypothetical protein A3D84_01950 [Candidatus Woesebacteria bacterium RIFCSPHIGHO2_02_FULL_42_20]|uniref:OmpR/PhoB-type domain-containing protein n=1 Tax=Candidatus Woesebacteria bacterium RIFCSPHIGHO2_12_FULL_41_24 TaxID=1802510 RepID=A0A1F8AUA7_9BACT|nr:MAG: hypothetical protein A2W15_04235 [Candidatus Woesebacteria bacterium RBG_16_41_13]OGM30011.1 MAG: hypothetical protein A2873_04785 [Candidatus Woesebacteria bacterium RIFCSPHIGHO2_01_FULL_42_80]OGM35089.1 MAG: hypothetical protein A3D84_01950 [Candidatus Woesebacteria bacterium RIFCSPHIGHO2_02_FULL_42_20]OGM54825.1 MAG: hypothetical protein A3E44_01550 [Candidatus Woesebacteria bacterium RIFCSPHIGHO2_12_FULL_41_24]OGM67441.1 MAG: hypothetical protein A2969_05400 [Candidatus Woesebacteri